MRKALIKTHVKPIDFLSNPGPNRFKEVSEDKKNAGLLTVAEYFLKLSTTSLYKQFSSSPFVLYVYTCTNRTVYLLVLFDFRALLKITSFFCP